jgi:hypothetical protein
MLNILNIIKFKTVKYNIPNKSQKSLKLYIIRSY